MRIVLLCLLVAVTGCLFHRKSATPAKQTTAGAVVTPDFKATGKIVVFNDQARFAIVNFPFGAMPKPTSTVNRLSEGIKSRRASFYGSAKRKQCRCGFNGWFRAEG